MKNARRAAAAVHKTTYQRRRRLPVRRRTAQVLRIQRNSFETMLLQRFLLLSVATVILHFPTEITPKTDTTVSAKRGIRCLSTRRERSAASVIGRCSN